MSKKQYIVISKETWSVIENLLMELPFKISSPVVKRIQEDQSILILDEEKYITLTKQNHMIKPSLGDDEDSTSDHPNRFEK